MRRAGDGLTTEVDVLVAGGGACGMSMAAHLAALGPRGLRVAVVDDGRHPVAERSWAFWSSRAELLDAAVSLRFRSVRVHAAGREVVLPLGCYEYRVVDGPSLHAVVRELCNGVRFLRGTVEEVVDDDPDGLARVVVDGRTVHAWWVLDGVSPDPAPPRPAAWLSFTGRQVVTDRDVFAPEPTLMDFRTEQADGVRFVYVLPRGPREALVEHTAFAAPAPHRSVPAPEAGGPGGTTTGGPGVTTTGEPAAEAALDEYLRGVLRVRGHRVTGTERGLLPLTGAPARRRLSAHVLAVGGRGGLVKASTGYAYGRIQRDCAAVARSLVATGHPFAVPSPHRRHRMLDAVLLRVLARSPRAIEPAFLRLFDRLGAETTLRFLDEDTRLAEEARVAATAGSRPFLRALLPC
ncbi:MAG: lycopene beta cyclase [Actinomycetales bacterium]|nr:lycopene beta cyclase [Actinomycetales bacterium]